MMRTSLTHPLIIAELAVGDRGGAIGVTFAPGKYQEAAMTGAWARDLEQDTSAIRQWGAAHLISLLEPWEFSQLRIECLPQVVEGQGISWHGLPITDGAAPDHRLLERWPVLGSMLVQGLHSGQRIVVHCKGGLGRAGTVAAMLLLQSRTVRTAQAAIDSVRRFRPGAVETVVQEEFLRQWARGLSS
ncbi:TPA: cyclin-dependent kinase inhibitor 3 family protein [Stenotrophomonas maltophilia]|nr:cyclin-dependent kinase inhibitor 3 family protein [Stenotrophomonas sp. SMYL36]